jgi:predicted amidohydrolase
MLATERDVVISAYQVPCADGNFRANLVVLRKVVAEALERGSDFLVLPETFLSGYDSLEHMRLGARAVDDPDLQAFISETAGHFMVVLVGMARITPGGIYNSVLIIQRGRLLGIYDKMMLTKGDRDKLGFLPGTTMPVFEANGVRLAVIICHDSSFPHPALLAKLQGAEILFSPHYNAISSDRMDAHRIWVRNCHIGLACQMKMVVVRANVVKTGERQLGYGDSFILSPRGDILVAAELFRQELITARITPSMFQSPYVWADINDVPRAVRSMLGQLLIAPSPQQ